MKDRENKIFKIYVSHHVYITILTRIDNKLTQTQSRLRSLDYIR